MEREAKRINFPQNRRPRHNRDKVFAYPGKVSFLHLSHIDKPIPRRERPVDRRKEIDYIKAKIATVDRAKDAYDDIRREVGRDKNEDIDIIEVLVKEQIDAQRLGHAVFIWEVAAAMIQRGCSDDETIETLIALYNQPPLLDDSSETPAAEEN